MRQEESKSKYPIEETTAGLIEPEADSGDGNERADFAAENKSCVKSIAALNWFNKKRDGKP